MELGECVGYGGGGGEEGGGGGRRRGAGQRGVSSGG